MRRRRMSDIEYIHSEYKRIRNNTKADDVPIYEMEKVVKAYQKGKADAIEEFKNRLLKNNVVDKSVVKRVAEQMKEDTDVR